MSMAEFAMGGGAAEGIRSQPQSVQGDGEESSVEESEDAGSQGQRAAQGQGDMEEESSDFEHQGGLIEDPFYDATADDKDERWVQKQRHGRVSDAILNCPGCFTTLCVDCQGHDKKHQWRAMFTMNCKVDTGRLVQATTGSAPATGKRGRGKEAPQEAASADTGIFYPVSCEVCDTEVGVLDANEGLYIFFNVFPSNA